MKGKDSIGQTRPISWIGASHIFFQGPVKTQVYLFYSLCESSLQPLITRLSFSCFCPQSLHFESSVLWYMLLGMSFVCNGLFVRNHVYNFRPSFQVDMTFIPSSSFLTSNLGILNLIPKSLLLLNEHPFSPGPGVVVW